MSEKKSSKDSKSDPKNTQKWNRMVVFGDSLSVSPTRFDEDFPEIPDPKRTSHFGQRFSNGWTMVEYLRDSLNIPTTRFHNFATGGETSDDMRQTQFPMFLEYKFDMNLGQSAEEAELYVVFGGSNDFAPFLVKVGADPLKGVKEFIFGKLNQEMSEVMDGTVERIVHVMENLYGCANARYFFVPNIPNVVSDLPLTKKVFNKYHDKLKKAVKKFKKEYKDTVVVIWDLSAVITDMQSHPNRYGLTQVSLFKNHEKTKTPPEETLFWDGAGHFTTKAHGELATNALKCLQKAVPNVKIPVRPEPVEEKEWSCLKCSFSNKPRRRRCEMCSFSKKSQLPDVREPQPPRQVVLTDWCCDLCTYINPRMTSKCGMCDSTPPAASFLNPDQSHLDFGQVNGESNALAAPGGSISQPGGPDGVQSGSSGGIDAQSVVLPTEEWVCARCTYSNAPGTSGCGVCTTSYEPPQDANGSEPENPDVDSNS